MSEVEKKKRGRVSKYGTHNEKNDAIAGDLALIQSGQANTLTMYYIQKLVNLGMVEIKLTENGQNFLTNNQ